MVGNKIYKCGNYLRLSKEDIRHGKDESSSIESQRLINSSFAKYNGLNIVREYVDDGFSCIFDFGFRLGGRTSGRLSWWDISLGCMANGGNVILNVGLGLGISLIAGTVAGSVGLATM